MWSPTPSRRQRTQRQQLAQQFRTLRAAERLERDRQGESEDFANRTWGHAGNETSRSRVERWVHDERGRRPDPFQTAMIDAQREERGDGEREEEGRGSASPPPYQSVDTLPLYSEGGGEGRSRFGSSPVGSSERPAREERARDGYGVDGRGYGVSDRLAREGGEGGKRGLFGFGGGR